MRRTIQTGIGLLLYFVLIASVQAELIRVSGGDNQGLINAIIAANNDPDITGIVIDPGPGGETTFTFTEAYMGGDSALPPITSTIFLFTENELTINFVRTRGKNKFRLFDVVDSGNLRLGTLEIVDQFNIDSFSVMGEGGAIRATGSSKVELRSVRFSDNGATGSGGAISIMGDAELFAEDCVFNSNYSATTGGAVSFTGNAFGTIDRCLFTLNSSTFPGGHINVSSSGTNDQGQALTLKTNTFTSLVDDSATIDNPGGSILASNNTFADSSDAVNTTDKLIVLHNIFFPRLPPNSKEKSSTPSTEAICNTFNIGKITSRGYNIESTDSCFLDQPTDQVNTDPMLLPADIDGVVALQTVSPAIDAGASVITNAVMEKFGLPCGYKDSRGLGRPQDANLDGVYECDIGSYEVQGGPDIGAPQSAAYFDTTRNGEGTFAEMIGGNQAFVAEFTYRIDGSGPAWFVGIGNIVGNSIVVDKMLQPVGGVFGAGFDPDAIDRQTVGSLSLVFSNCLAGSDSPGKLLFESSPDSLFGDLLVDAFRLSTIVDCQNNAATQAGRSGSFFDVDRSGEGIFVQWLSNGSVVVIWYTFDPQGKQFWTINGTTTINGNTVTAEMLYPASSTTFGSQFDESEIDLQPWGTVTLEYLPGCNSIAFSYNSTVAGFGTGNYDYSRLTSLTGTTCDL